MLPHYYSVNEYLQKEYGKKMYKLTLNGGMSCPNRDGLIDTRGCIFCSGKGSGDFAVTDIEAAKQLISNKYKGSDYIAYFQSFTNTYADVSYLRNLYMPIVLRDDIRILSIATRPDCLNENVLELLYELNRIKPVWIELGLQTTSEKSAEYIRRGYSLETFDKAVKSLHEIGIKVIAHMIIGLPDEDVETMLNTAKYIASLNVFGIKLQLLHILKGTDLFTDYKSGLFKTLSMEEYVSIVGRILTVLPKDMVIHRITGDGPKNILEAPVWSTDKKRVLNYLNGYLKENNIIQGSKCHEY